MTKPQIVTYPTGLKVRRLDYRGLNGRVLLHVEQTLSHGRAPAFKLDNIGDCHVTGSIIPRGAKGAVCHESLPLWTYRVSRLRDAKATWAAACAAAWRVYARLLETV